MDGHAISACNSSPLNWIIHSCLGTVKAKYLFLFLRFKGNKVIIKLNQTYIIDLIFEKFVAVLEISFYTLSYNSTSGYAPII